MRRDRLAHSFVKACEPPQNSKITHPLGRAINMAFNEALRYYRQNRGTGDAQLDISLFFKNRKNHHRMFEKYWASVPRSRDKFERNIKRFQKVLDTLANDGN
jgi:hypothetical protein